MAEVIQIHASRNGSAIRYQTPMTPEQLRGATSLIRSREHAAMKAERAKRKQMEIEGRLIESGVKARFAKATLDDCKDVETYNQKTVELCKRWAGQFAEAKARGSNLILLGSVGCGKTWLASAMLSEVAWLGFSVSYIRESDLLMNLRRAYGQNAEVSEVDTLRALTAPDLLCIDELGVGIGKPETRQSQLFGILDARYSDVRPTMLVSNLDPSALERHLGPRSWSRLRDGNSSLLRIDGPDHRQASA